MTYYYMGDATSFNPFQALTFLILITTPFILGDDGTAATSSSPVISTGPYSYSDPFNLSMGVILAVLITKRKKQTHITTIRQKEEKGLTT